ncbi:MAG: mycofactocin biosynthesis chaperone MftB [Acidimicrobiales bacterium]
MDGPWKLHPQVALRPEPFGALAYHYGTRRLTFLRSPELVELVRHLGDHGSLEDALRASTIDERRWPSYRTALRALVQSELLVPSAA